jgi:two-component system, NtrC family, response regulator HydG
VRAAGADPARQREWNATLREYHTSDDAMQTCLDLARIAARTSLPVLILGETGTGKTLLARVIHNTSRRARNPFVAFNSAALSETLLDSQLFGHEKGAFTGADRRVKGKFELADQGTLFLDEIADMSPTAQAKILRAVEYGEFERLGSEALLEADVRLISATHLPITRFLHTDTFRKDLFYRISGITLRVPALRDRPNDLRSLMAAEIAAASAAQEKAIVGLSRAAADRLLAYHWPGNLRELKRVIDTAVAITDGDVIEVDALLIDSGAGPDEPGGSKAAPPAPSIPEGDLSLASAERRHILAVLEQCGGNKRRAARLLGLARSTLDRKLAQS